MNTPLHVMVAAAAASVAVVSAAALTDIALADASAPTHAPAAALAIKRSLPNGRTDVIKAMGNLKWSDVEIQRSPTS